MSELRERVAAVVYDFKYGPSFMTAAELLRRVTAILEDTGAPAYMRVAADLRGEVASED